MSRKFTVEVDETEIAPIIRALLDRADKLQSSKATKDQVELSVLDGLAEKFAHGCIITLRTARSE